ncbi:MAG: FKBP-type peptidyl-prolyl cis-trans isomerase, partial [Paraburkholderia hospita]
MKSVVALLAAAALASVSLTANAASTEKLPSGVVVE